MSEENPSATTAEALVPRQPSKGHSVRWAAARRRLMELLIVFLGVYTAFLLNRLDSDRRDAKRRSQILASLEQEVSSTVQSYRQEIAQSDAEFAEFDAAMARGEMPALGIVMNSSDYSASDDATLLQSGGLELLDMQTIDLLREANAMQRSLLATMHNQFELSLIELTNHTSADFYDPATHQLKKTYQWYPRVLHNALSQGQEILLMQEKLLAHIHAEQHPAATPAATPAPLPAGQTKRSRSPAASR